jgi:hypothetical protein
VLTCSTSALKERLAFLSQLGLDGQQIARIVTSNPRVRHLLIYILLVPQRAVVSAAPKAARCSMWMVLWSSVPPPPREL